MGWAAQTKCKLPQKICIYTRTSREEAGIEGQKNFLWQYWEAPDLCTSLGGHYNTLSLERKCKGKSHTGLLHEQITTLPKYRMWGSEYDLAGSASSRPKSRGQPSWELNSPTGLKSHFQNSSLHQGSEVRGKLKPSTRQTPLPKWMVPILLGLTLQTHIQKFCALPSRAVSNLS